MILAWVSPFNKCCLSPLWVLVTIYCSIAVFCFSFVHIDLLEIFRYRDFIITMSAADFYRSKIDELEDNNRNRFLKNWWVDRQFRENDYAFGANQRRIIFAQK